MKQTVKFLFVALTILIVATIVQMPATSQPQQPVPQQQDPIVTLKLPLTQVSTMVYALRYSSLLTSDVANKLADEIVRQANDTTINKITQPVPPKKE